MPLSAFAFKCFQGGIDGVDDERTKLTISEIDCIEGVTKCLRRQAGNLLICSQILINQKILINQIIAFQRMIEQNTVVVHQIVIRQTQHV